MKDNLLKSAALLVNENPEVWNPLENNEEALLLSIQLRISVDFSGTSDEYPAFITASWRNSKYSASTRNFVTVKYIPDKQLNSASESDIRFVAYLLDNYPELEKGVAAATRLAIVTAAANIARDKYLW